MRYDRQITISSAGSRRSTRWPASTLLWSELCERLKTPVRSTETYEEYLKLSKAKQDDLKDVGGFVAGTFNGDRRKANAVTGRDVVTLDLDSIPAGQTENILQRIRGLNAGYCVYSTRKHHPAAPRLRILLPLNRTVSAEEYEPIARKLAAFIGIDLADPTTFEASRLMYWPSVSSNGEYVHEVGDKPFVDASGVLGLYPNWRDTTSWPQVPEAPEALQKRAEKQQDPTEKSGIIGAFCKIYDVPAAIDAYLYEQYTEVPGQTGRYTYTGGSTVGGAVVYDNGAFLYSHHATDPASGQLSNSFDLVRLHLFGDQDDEALPGTPVNRLPSFDLMCKTALSDEKVSRLLNEERYTAAIGAFETLSGMSVEHSPQMDTAWMDKLSISKRGEIDRTTNNIYIILNHDPYLAGKIAFDEFSNRGLVLGSLPWNKNEVKRDWSDADDAGLRQYLETVYNVSGIQKINDAVTNTAMLHRFNDVKTYLSSLKWDGENRIDTVLIDYFGAEDNVYTRAISRKFFAAATARVFQPGIKFDYMIIMSGPQGCGKSTFLSRIGGRWYSDSLNTFEGKEASEAIQGVWICEVGELNGMTRSEITAVKGFLSKQDDIFREAYGRRTVKFPRRCVFVGTTNDSEFLRDRTGNRRFWPIDLLPEAATLNVFEDLTENVIDQLWAEGLEAWRQGEKLYLTGEAAELALVHQEEHLESNPKEGWIREYLDTEIPLNWYSLSLMQRRAYLAGEFRSTVETKLRDRVCAAEVWEECLGGDRRWLKRTDSVEISSIIASFPDWKKTKNSIQFGPYNKQKGFLRVELSAELSSKRRLPKVPNLKIVEPSEPGRNFESSN